MHVYLKYSMKGCFPKCFKKEPEPSASTSSAAIPPITDQQKICLKCSFSQSVAKDASVFVCTSCHTVNRIEQPDSSLPTYDELVSLQRVNSSTFLPLSNAPSNHSETVITQHTGIAPCSICLDAPGDMIFLNCHHGGFCEACTRHIAGNNAVGGACCVKCRSPIKKVVRILELDQGNSVKAVPVEVVKVQNKSAAPPKVPPPRGFNKAKKQ